MGCGSSSVIGIDDKSSPTPITPVTCQPTNLTLAMASQGVEENVVKDLERSLRQRYGFLGTLSGIKFSENTNEAFNQLTRALETVKMAETAETEDDATPKVGDRAFVFWHGYGWYTAIIKSWLPDELSYMIKWTDGNWAAERASFKNLSVDRTPSTGNVGVGTKVLFKQGLYYCGMNDDGSICDSTGRRLTDAKKEQLARLGQISDRWHMGKITRITRNDDGDLRYHGQHADSDDPQASGNNYVGYSQTFIDLKISDLRTMPNVFNCVDDSPAEESFTTSCDVFVSKVPKDNEIVNRLIGQFRDKYAVGSSNEGGSSVEIQGTVKLIKNCSVYLVCLSDNFISDSQAMSELLYAKKTLGKTVIPVVLGRSGNWLHTTAGMLLAGQLYIQFGDPDVWEEKTNELQANLERLVISDHQAETTSAPSSSSPPRIFLSYCWTNSKASYDAGQVRDLVGHEFADPRKIKKDLERELGEDVWLDIEQLNSVDDSGMFGQIAEGLKNSNVVVMCVSKEYTSSQNCKMEANFALRSLHKSAVVLEVGSGMEQDREAWKSSSIGMVLPTDHSPYIMTVDTTNTSQSYDVIIKQICDKLKQQALPPVYKDAAEPIKGEPKGPPAKESSLRSSVPMLGDSVIVHYAAWQFFPAKVAAFDKQSLKYTVNWDDPDPSCRVQPYNLVAINRAPTDDLIGVGSQVLFIQGTYRFGASTGDVWNLGVITRIFEEDGVKFYDGKHSKTAADGLAVASWPSYRPTFEKARCTELRLFPNAIEMLQVYRNL